MSIKAIGGLLGFVKKTKTDDFIKKNHTQRILYRQGNDAAYIKSEFISDNRRLAVIEKHDYTQYPFSSVIIKKVKFFIDNRLVNTDFNRRYNHQPYWQGSIPENFKDIFDKINKVR